MKRLLALDRSLLEKLIVLKAVMWCLACITLLCVYHFFEVSLSLNHLLIILGAGFVLIPLWWWRLSFSWPVFPFEIFLLLLSEVVLLALLVQYSGGIANPFTSSLLVPLALSAALLPKRYGVSLVLVAFAIYAAWVLLGRHDHHMHHANFALHLYGMWINFILSAVILYAFISYAIGAAKAREVLLQQAREKILHDEQVIALAINTASTAHALGTPLSTMAILLEEWEQEVGDKSGEALVLFRQQLSVCREYLASIGEVDELQEEGEGVEAFELFQEVKNRILLLHPSAEITFECDPLLTKYEITSHSVLTLAIINLIENAIHAGNKVHLNFSFKAGQLHILISDDGVGFDPEIQRRFGQTFFESDKGGWGVGVYLSNATVERYGGKIRVNEGADGGSEIEVMLPAREI